MFPYTIIDLTHTITPSIPLWPGSDPFSMKIRYDYHEVGCRAAAYSFVAGTGTHMDAPAHFIKGAPTIDALPAHTLIAPLCLIDVSEKARSNQDYTLQPSDLHAWEKQYGQIPASSIVVMRSDWSKRWPDLKAFLNEDQEGKKHFPGFSTQAAQLLLERNVAGIGIDTFSLDAGIATTFPVHHLMLAQGIFFIECLTNLDQLPPHGAFICALPLNIADAPECPARVVALIPR